MKFSGCGWLNQHSRTATEIRINHISFELDDKKVYYSRIIWKSIFSYLAGKLQNFSNGFFLLDQPKLIEVPLGEKKRSMVSGEDRENSAMLSPNKLSFRVGSLWHFYWGIE